MNLKTRILILSNSQLHRDPRVAVQIEALKDYFELVCCGQSKPNNTSVEFIPFSKAQFRSLLGIPRIAITHFLRKRWWKTESFERIYFSQETVRQTLRRLINVECDIIICNDIDTLPMAVQLKNRNGARIYLDAHEYTPREFDAEESFKPITAYWSFLLQKYARDVDCFTTVCESIASEYEQNFDLKASEIVYNLPFPCRLTPSEVLSDKVRLVHHGGISPLRKPEVMIDLMHQLDSRFSLDFIFVESQSSYFQQFKERCREHPRISFRKPVPTHAISSYINPYDIGLYLLESSNYNNRVALPNKFFEFVQARLGVAIWPSVEMAKITNKFNLGIISDDFTVESMATKLNEITAEMTLSFKRNSDLAAQTLNAKDSMVKIKKLVDSLLGR